MLSGSEPVGLIQTGFRYLEMFKLYFTFTDGGRGEGIFREQTKERRSTESSTRNSKQETPSALAIC